MGALNKAKLGKRNNMMNSLFKNKVVDINYSKKQTLYICLKDNNVKKFIRIALKCPHTGI